MALALRSAHNVSWPSPPATAEVHPSGLPLQQYTTVLGVPAAVVQRDTQCVGGGGGSCQVGLAVVNFAAGNFPEAPGFCGGNFADTPRNVMACSALLARCSLTTGASCTDLDFVWEISWPI